MSYEKVPVGSSASRTEILNALLPQALSRMTFDT